jgi:hypothetical protein
MVVRPKVSAKGDPGPRSPAPVGYSGTPLPKRLGIKPGMAVAVLHGPADFKETLGPLPDRVNLRTSLRRQQRVDLVLAFVTERRHLGKNIGWLVGTLAPDGALWVAWPKKASGVETDISDEVIRGVALPIGWVDIKVCEIGPTWSGLKLVLRKELRPKRTTP